jgi:hypothetical protein
VVAVSLRFLALAAFGMMTACAGAQSAAQERADA